MTALALVVSGPLADGRRRRDRARRRTVTAWQFGKWPVLLLLVLVILHVLYFASPNAKVGVKWVSAGALLTLVVWIVASARSRSTSPSSAPTTRPTARMGGVVVFLLWLWITNIAVLLGVEFNAEIGADARDAGGPAGRRARAQGPRARPPVAEAARQHRLTPLVRWAGCRRPWPTSPRCASAARPGASSRPRRGRSPPCARPTRAGEPLLILAGGSNLVVADAGFPGTVLRIAARVIEAATGRVAAPASRGTRSWRAASPRAWPASSACPASPARSARRRSRTSAPTGRRWPTRSSPCAPTTATRRVREIPARVRLRLPLERVQARAGPLGRARGDLRAARSAPLEADPLRRAGARARRREGDRAARRRARGGARAAPPQGHGARPGRSRTRSPPARSSPTPCSTPEAFAALEARAATARRARPASRSPTGA